jgi:predicted RND superfamily exporter protein
MVKDHHSDSTRKLLDSIQKITDFFNLINPLMTLIILLFGVLMLFGGIFFMYSPPTQPLTAGIGIFALGLALISFGINQWKSYESKITIQEINERLIRMEKKFDKMENSE